MHILYSKKNPENLPIHQKFKLCSTPRTRKMGPLGHHLNPSVSASLELEVTSSKRVNY